MGLEGCEGEGGELKRQLEGRRRGPGEKKGMKINEGGEKGKKRKAKNTEGDEK